jgi:hypothetical protein
MPKNMELIYQTFPNKQVLGNIELDGQVEILAFSEFAGLAA